MTGNVSLVIAVGYVPVNPTVNHLVTLTMEGVQLGRIAPCSVKKPLHLILASSLFSAPVSEHVSLHVDTPCVCSKAVVALAFTVSSTDNTAKETSPEPTESASEGEHVRPFSHKKNTGAGSPKKSYTKWSMCSQNSAQPPPLHGDKPPFGLTSRQRTHSKAVVALFLPYLLLQIL